MLQVEIYNKKKSNGQASDKFKRKKRTHYNPKCYVPERFFSLTFVLRVILRVKH